MAEFKVEFNGNSKGVHDWVIHLNGGLDTTDLTVDRKHALNVVDSVFDALSKVYKLKGNDTQAVSKGDNSNAQ